MSTKLIFKENKPTGKWRSFYQSNWDVKINKVKLFRINRLSFEDRTGRKPFSISFAVENNDKTVKNFNENCKWRNLTLAKRFDTIEEAKEFLIEKVDIILSNYRIWNIETNELFTL